MDVRDEIGFKAHKPGAGCIRGNRIVCENNGAKRRVYQVPTELVEAIIDQESAWNPMQSRRRKQRILRN